MMDMPTKIPETIRISKKNAERLITIGKFGETFDDVLGRILDGWEEEKRKS